MKTGTEKISDLPRRDDFTSDESHREFGEYLKEKGRMIPGQKREETVPPLLERKTAIASTAIEKPEDVAKRNREIVLRIQRIRDAHLIRPGSGYIGVGVINKNTLTFWRDKAEQEKRTQGPSSGKYVEGMVPVEKLSTLVPGLVRR